MENTNKANHDAANFRNIIIFSCGFMLLMAAWMTTAGIEQTILQSVQVDDPTFTGDGYLSQAIVQGSFSLTNFIAPTIVTLVGVRTTLVLGTCFYTVFISSLLYPSALALYITSACIGFGAANVWVANGVYFTRSTTKETIGKYVGIYWAIMALGQLFGNVFVFWRFQGMNHIDHDTRFLVVSILTVFAILSSVTFIFLGVPPGYKKVGETKKNVNILASITQPFRVMCNKHMLLLIPAAMYNGVEIAFLSSIYPTAVAFSEGFGGDTRKLVGVAGILIGMGSVFGGLVFGTVVDKFVKSKRTFTITSCCLIHTLSFVLMYLNLSDGCPLGPTLDISWINPPSIPIAMFCAFCLGVGDGCISTQMAAAIGVVWPEDPSSALAIYRFFQAATCAACYFVSTLTGLYNQLIMFFAVALLGTISFRINEGLIAKMDEYAVKSCADPESPQDPPVSITGERKLSTKSTAK